MPAPAKSYALVTGSAKRLGRAIALALSEAGFDLVLHYRRSKNEAQKLAKEVSSRGTRAALLSADLATRQGIVKAQKKLADFPETISLFVHNASLFQPIPFSQVSYEDLFQNFHIHAFAPFCIAQTLLAKGLRQAIFMGDWATQRPYKNFAPYLASKGALETLVRVLAVELAPRVRVNGVQPGPILPPPGYNPKKLAEKTLLKRIGGSESIVQALLFLCSNDFVTGTLLTIDGGRSIFEKS